jgi:hypothetical protein
MITRGEAGLEGMTKSISLKVISKIVHLCFSDQRKIAENLDKEAMSFAS